LRPDSNVTETVALNVEEKKLTGKGDQAAGALGGGRLLRGAMKREEGHLGGDLPIIIGEGGHIIGKMMSGTE
jgi:hypothetical protein